MEVIMARIIESTKYDILDNLKKLLSAELSSKSKAKTWFQDYEKLTSKTQECYSTLELKSHQNTACQDLLKEKERFESNILSKVLQAREELLKKYLNCPFKYDMHPFDDKRTEKILKAHLELIKNEKEASKLRRQESFLIQEYRLFMAREKATCFGKDYLISYLSSLRVHPQEEIRKMSFQSLFESLSKKKHFLMNTFLELVKNRRSQAKLSSHSYKKISYLELNKYDSESFQIEMALKDLIRKKIPILLEKLITQNKQKNLKCYDLAFYPDYPKFEVQKGQFYQTIETLLQNLEPKFKTIFLELKEASCLDLFSRQGKSPGTFTIPLLEKKLAFIFGNFKSSLKDILNCMHEFGHALHILYSYKTENFFLRNTSIGFSELIASIFEFQTLNHLDKIGIEISQKNRFIKYHIIQTLLSLCKQACVDDFESVLYNDDVDYGEDEVLQLWDSLYDKYFPFVEWPKTFLDYKKIFWFNLQHIFYATFYSFEYNLANSAALILHYKENSLSQKRLIETLSLGGQVDDSTLYNKLGIDYKRLPFLFDSMLSKLWQDFELK